MSNILQEFKESFRLYIKPLTLVFWRMYYTLKEEPETLEEYLLKYRRLGFSRFRSHIWYNKNEQRWEIYFKDEPYYTAIKNVVVHYHISVKTNEIVGFAINDNQSSSPIVEYTGE
jgi:hypothetical protein